MKMASRKKPLEIVKNAHSLLLLGLVEEQEDDYFGFFVEYRINFTFSKLFFLTYLTDLNCFLQVKPLKVNLLLHFI